MSIIEIFAYGFVFFLFVFGVCRNFATRDRGVIFSDTPIHDAFGLSYDSYYVMPRLVLESMPVDWQKQFLLLNDEVFKYLKYKDPAYCVLRCPHEREKYNYESGELEPCTDDCPRYVFDPLSNYRHGHVPRKVKS
jgi:hypothetical protein